MLWKVSRLVANGVHELGLSTVTNSSVSRCIVKDECDGSLTGSHRKTVEEIDKAVTCHRPWEYEYE